MSEEGPKVTIDLKEYLENFEKQVLAKIESTINAKFQDCADRCVFAVDWFGKPYANPPVPGWRDKLKVLWHSHQATKKRWAKIIASMSFIGAVVGAVLDHLFHIIGRK